MAPDGALMALEFSQNQTYLSYVLKGGLEMMTKRLDSSPPAMQSFLLSMAVSLSGVCQLNWGKKDAWHSLVEALLLELPDSQASLLPANVIFMMAGGTDSTVIDRKDVVAKIISSPHIAMTLLLRWLRYDVIQVESALRDHISARNTPTFS